MNSDLSKLRESFGDYQSTQMDQKWEAVKTTLKHGVEVTGKVIARVPFGIFLDIGVGFPALIRVHDLKNADVRPYTSMEMYPTPGSNTTGTVIGFNDRNRQIDLTQRHSSRPTLVHQAPPPGG